MQMQFVSLKYKSACVCVLCVQVREWTRKLRHEMRGIDRSIRSIDFEERKVVAEIKAAAKRNDVQSCKVLAKEVVRSRNAKTRQ